MAGDYVGYKFQRISERASRRAHNPERPCNSAFRYQDTKYNSISAAPCSRTFERPSSILWMLSRMADAIIRNLVRWQAQRELRVAVR